MGAAGAAFQYDNLPEKMYHIFCLKKLKRLFIAVKTNQNTNPF